MSPAVMCLDAERIVVQANDRRHAGKPEAIALVRSAIDAHPHYPVLWQMLGLIHREAQDSPEAVVAFGLRWLSLAADPSARTAGGPVAARHVGWRGRRRSGGRLRSCSASEQRKGGRARAREMRNSKTRNDPLAGTRILAAPTLELTCACLLPVCVRPRDGAATAYAATRL